MRREMPCAGCGWGCVWGCGCPKGILRPGRNTINKTWQRVEQTTKGKSQCLLVSFQNTKKEEDTLQTIEEEHHLPEKGAAGKQGAWQLPLRLTIARPTAIVWVLFAVPAAAATFFGVSRGLPEFRDSSIPRTPQRINSIYYWHCRQAGREKRELAF